MFFYAPFWQCSDFKDPRNTAVTEQTEPPCVSSVEAEQQTFAGLLCPEFSHDAAKMLELRTAFSNLPPAAIERSSDTHTRTPVESSVSVV